MSEESHETVGEIIAVARDKYTVHECNECTRRKCCELKFDSAECREEREDIFLSFGIEDGYFSDLLNRIEAAWKRERVGNAAAKRDERLMLSLLLYAIEDYVEDWAEPNYKSCVQSACKRLGIEYHSSARQLWEQIEEKIKRMEGCANEKPE